LDVSKLASPKDAAPPRDAFSLPAHEQPSTEPAPLGSCPFTAPRDHKGRKLCQPRIVLIYWGSAWASAATEPSQGELTAAISELFTGPWGAQLAKHRGIGPISLEQVAQVPHLDPPANFSNRWVRTFIDGLIARGTVPAPSNSVDRIYCVLMPPGCSSLDHPESSGQHQHYDRADGTRVYWAWIANDGTLTGIHSIPTIMSEELVEACSYPDRN
jgi:hypothetical protein